MLAVVAASLAAAAAVDAGALAASDAWTKLADKLLHSILSFLILSFASS